VTLAKTCHASNMMQELVEATHNCDHKSCLNRNVSIVPLLNWKKLNLILKLEVAMLNKYISHLLHIVLLQILSGTFLPNII